MRGRPAVIFPIILASKVYFFCHFVGNLHIIFSSICFYLLLSFYNEEILPRNFIGSGFIFLK